MDDTDSVILEIDPVVLSQLSLVCSLKSITEAVQIFLTNVIETAGESGRHTENGNVVVSRKQIQKMSSKKGHGASDSLISRRLGALCEMNVCHLTVHAGTVGRERYHHYQLGDLTPLVALPQIRREEAKPKQKRTKSLVNIQRELFRKDEAAILLQGHKELSVHFHQQIFNGILDTAMRLSHKDSRQVIEARYIIAGNPLVIKATCSSSEDSGIAILTDQRAMRPIISYCKKEVARRRAKLVAEHGESFVPAMVPNLFRLDIHELCDLMGMKPLTENIDRVVSMMQRLADTTFRVDARENEWFRQTFSLMMGGDDVKSDTFEFKFLQNLEIAHEHASVSDLFGADPKELRPRFYSFSLEIRLFYSLVIDNATTIYIAHNGLSQEQSGIVQRFYNWARSWVSGRDKPGMRNKWYSVLDMHEKLTPAARFDNFRTHFISALEKFAVEGNFKRGKSGKSLVYGYYVYYESRADGEWFRFERDRNDSIVGDNSRHNVLVRQNLLADIGVGYGEHSYD